jgi:hypothetical protein
MFSNNDNTDVVFGDINLSEAPTLKGEPHNPGAGGWPTIRYFNTETGVEGGSYTKVTDLPMCSELGDRMHMMDYIEDYGNTVLCGVDGTHCTETELAYLAKMKDGHGEDAVAAQQAQLDRLEGMLLKPMNSNLQEWAYRRMRILKKLLAAAAASDESEAPPVATNNNEQDL